MPKSPRGIELKQRTQLLQMRQAGLVVARALQAVATEIRPGVTTEELDAVAAEVIAAAGAEPSFLGYQGFPAVTCISVNDEIVHGIPGSRVLAAGDLVSVDCGAIVNGWHGDSARTVFVGEPSPEKLALSEATRAAMWQGIAAARLGGHIGDISNAIERYVDGLDVSYGIVEEYVGHGIGSAMHQPPDVPNYGKAGRGPKIVEGMALAIEPMLTLRSAETRVLADDWTVVTVDGQPAAHWEHTMTVTKNGIWVLTAEDGGEQMLTQLGVPFGALGD